MKKTFKLLIVSALSLGIVSSCSADRTREDKAAAIIGKIDSPFLVVSMTPQNLMDKSGILDGVLPFTYELVLAFFIDESVTGIDYGVKTQIVVGKGQSFQPNFYGIFKVKDEKKFTELIEKEANARIVEKEGVKTAIKESDGYALVWNEEFAIIGNVPVDFAAMFTGGGKGQGDKTVTKLIELVKAADDAEINATYADFLKKDADLSMYFDGKGFYGYMQEMTMGESEEIEKMKETYEGISSEFYINFTNGAVDMNFTNHLSASLKEKMNFMGEKGIEGKLLNYAYSPTPILVGGYNMKFSKFFDYLESEMEEGAYNDVEKDVTEMGLTMEDVKSSMTGEFVYMIDRVVAVEETIDYGYGEPYTYTARIPMFALILGVSNPSIVQKILVDSLRMPNGSYHVGDAYLVLDGDVLFASNDSSWSNKVISKNTTSVTHGKDILAANPFSIFVDFAGMSSMNDLNDVAAYVGLFTEFSGGANLDEGAFTFKMKDASKNSLRIIAETISDELTRLEKNSNQSIDEELEEAALEGLNDLEEDLEDELP